MVSSPLSDKTFAVSTGCITAMDGAVAVVAATVKPTSTGGATKVGIPAIGGARVARPVMALLAKIRLFFFQQLECLGAVRRVAFWTIFFNRRVFPYIGTALFSMALVAELIDVLGLDAAMAQSAVGVVAIGTLDLAFNYRVVRVFVGLRFNVLVAFEAFLRLLCGRFCSFVD